MFERGIVKGLSEIFEFLTEFNFISVFVRLFLAGLFGGIIGLERGIKRRPAGLRTFSLVCVGAAMAMISNEYLFLTHNQIGDVSRMSSQVISGIGFLGAGTIILKGDNKTKGLTTAASLWATATIGICLGEGFYLGAFFGFILIMFITVLLYKIDEIVNIKSKVIELYVKLNGKESILFFMDYIERNEFEITSFQKDSVINGNNEFFMIFVEFNMKNKEISDNIINEIALIKGVEFVKEIK